MRVKSPATRAAVLVLATIGALAVPAVAGAATLDGTGGVLTYTAAGGQANSVEFNDTAVPGTVEVVNNAIGDAITPSGTCIATVANTFECPGIASISADAGDLNDVLVVTTATIPSALVGGAGNDDLTGGSAADQINGGDGDDFLDGGAGEDSLSGGDGGDFLFGDVGNDSVTGGSGNDDLEGGAGTDSLSGDADDDTLGGGAGADNLSGGSGIDTVFLFGTPDVAGTIDGLPNDGGPGEGDNVNTDVEDMSAGAAGSPSGPGTVTLVGSGGTNNLFVFSGQGNITGGPGNDALNGGSLDDTINARDGFADRVLCGAGNDTAVVDTLDVVSSSCENVQSLDVGNANEDRPPTVAFTSPAANGATIATARPTTLTATASDDRGVGKVQFLDDDRIVCEDATAPYSCDYSPRGEDVGRNTLVAMAIDTSQQTATALRTTAVGRFAPRALTLSLSPRRDESGPFRFRASGRLRLPTGVSPALGCAGGTVSVRVKAGRKTLSNRSVRLKSNCTYSLRVTFRNRGRFTGNGVLQFRARYEGNTVLRSDASKSVRARTR